jgi:hypothetical protein
METNAGQQSPPSAALAAGMQARLPHPLNNGSWSIALAIVCTNVQCLSAHALHARCCVRRAEAITCLNVEEQLLEGLHPLP